MKNNFFFEKLECCFLIESTAIESTTFPYKTALSKVNVKRQIEWEVQNGPTTKNAVCLSILYRTLRLLLYLFENWTWLLEPRINSPFFIFMLSVKAWVLFEDVFSLWVSLAGAISSYQQISYQRYNLGDNNLEITIF